MIAAISGGSGFQGSAVKNMLKQMGYEVVSLSRKDLYDSAEALSGLMRGAELVVHLAGAPIIGRWTKKYRREIYDSRIVTTRNLVVAMDLMTEKPRTFICASAVGIYPTEGAWVEDDTVVANNFLGEVCRDWEAEAAKAPAEIRVLNFRFGVVLGKNGGALPRLMLPFRFFAGGRIASGKQAMSWIHLSDVLTVFKFAIENPELSGPVNLAAPQTLTNAAFTKTLAKVMKRPAVFPVPEFALKLVFGKGAMVLTEGQEAIPKKLLDAGFRFKFPKLKEALEDLLK
ncbi:MAG: TIGR01777 family oxidoreductase [Bacteroidales bacterium]|nr:TIGR01777 family oxidoreductase [Bacteroidales bacterium]